MNMFLAYLKSKVVGRPKNRLGKSLWRIFFETRYVYLSGNYNDWRIPLDVKVRLYIGFYDKMTREAISIQDNIHY